MIYRIYLYKDETAISILKDFELYAKFYDIKDFEIYLNWLSKYAAKEGGYVFGQISNFNMGKLLFQIVEEEGKRLINDFPDIYPGKREDPGYYLQQVYIRPTVFRGSW